MKTREQIYQAKYWKRNKKRITKKRKTVWKKKIAAYMKEYFKKNAKKWKAYQKEYRKEYYRVYGR